MLFATHARYEMYEIEMFSRNYFNKRAYSAFDACGSKIQAVTLFSEESDELRLR